MKVFSYMVIGAVLGLGIYFYHDRHGFNLPDVSVSVPNK